MYDSGYEPRFQIRVDKRYDGEWSFGIALSHFFKETYLYITFYKWCISIGYLYDYEENWIDEF
jgi:hypothetical protein